MNSTFNDSFWSGDILENLNVIEANYQSKKTGSIIKKHNKRLQELSFKAPSKTIRNDKKDVKSREGPNTLFPRSPKNLKKNEDKVTSEIKQKDPTPLDKKALLKLENTKNTSVRTKTNVSIPDIGTDTLNDFNFDGEHSVCELKENHSALFGNEKKRNVSKIGSQPKKERGSNGRKPQTVKKPVVQCKEMKNSQSSPTLRRSSRLKSSTSGSASQCRKHDTDEKNSENVLEEKTEDKHNENIMGMKETIQLSNTPESASKKNSENQECGLVQANKLEFTPSIARNQKQKWKQQQNSCDDEIIYKENRLRTDGGIEHHSEKSQGNVAIEALPRQVNSAGIMPRNAEDESNISLNDSLKDSSFLSNDSLTHKQANNSLEGSDPTKPVKTRSRRALKRRKLLAESPGGTILKSPLDTTGNTTVLSSQTKLQLGSWGLPDAILKCYEECGVQTMFPWQAECLTQPGVLDGHNLVYSAPTSAGKTLVAELLLVKKVIESGKKGIFILPFVSVAREKMNNLKKLLSVAGVRVEGFMGSQGPPGGLQRTDVAVCTIEKANNIINRLLEGKGLGDLGIIVVDELHMLGDPHRGYLLELLLTKVMYVCKKALMSEKKEESPPCQVQIVGMSATLPNIDLLAHWLDARLYTTQFRPVPLKETVKLNKSIYDSSFSKIRDIDPRLTVQGDSDQVIQLCLETVFAGYSVLVFCPTKARCEKLSENMAKEFFNIGKPDSTYAPAVSGRLRECLNTVGISRVLEALKNCPVGLDRILGRSIAFGTAFHHAGLTYEERDIVEGAFKNGMIKVLMATSTLSSGVNLPARRVIIRSPVFGGSLLDTLTYKQMIGRAGRKGIDDTGESVLVCQPSERHKAEHLLNAALPPVSSCLQKDNSLTSSMKRAILEVIVSGVAKSPMEVAMYSGSTMLATSLQNEQISEGNSLRRDGTSTCISFLEENEFIRLQDTGEGEQYIGTQLGCAVVAAGLSPDEGLHVFRELHQARQCFVLENELHVIYQVTPIYVSGAWPNMDWMAFLRSWESLRTDMKRVGQLVGVEESFIVRAMKGTVNKKIKSQAQKLAIHQRFFTALTLHSLVQEVPLNMVAHQFSASRGMLQSLQQSAATFAGMVTVFCNRLGWHNLELLVAQFQDRLHFGIQRELCDLVRLSLLNGQRARILYNKGYETVNLVASAHPNDIENVLTSATPFESNKMENTVERGATIWVSNRDLLTEKQIAELLVKEAQEIVQKEIGICGIDWRQKPRGVSTVGGARSTKRKRTSSRRSRSSFRSSISPNLTLNTRNVNVSRHSNNVKPIQNSIEKSTTLSASVHHKQGTSGPLENMNLVSPKGNLKQEQQKLEKERGVSIEMTENLCPNIFSSPKLLKDNGRNSLAGNVLKENESIENGECNAYTEVARTGNSCVEPSTSTKDVSVGSEIAVVSEEQRISEAEKQVSLTRHVENKSCDSNKRRKICMREGDINGAPEVVRNDLLEECRIQPSRNESTMAALLFRNSKSKTKSSLTIDFNDSFAVPVSQEPSVQVGFAASHMDQKNNLKCQEITVRNDEHQLKRKEFFSEQMNVGQKETAIESPELLFSDKGSAHSFDKNHEALKKGNTPKAQVVTGTLYECNKKKSELDDIATKLTFDSSPSLNVDEEPQVEQYSRNPILNVSLNNQVEDSKRGESGNKESEGAMNLSCDNLFNTTLEFDINNMDLLEGIECKGTSALPLPRETCREEEDVNLNDSQFENIKIAEEHKLFEDIPLLNPDTSFGHANSQIMNKEIGTQNIKDEEEDGMISDSFFSSAIEQWAGMLEEDDDDEDSSHCIENAKDLDLSIELPDDLIENLKCNRDVSSSDCSDLFPEDYEFRGDKGESILHSEGNVIPKYKVKETTIKRKSVSPHKRKSVSFYDVCSEKLDFGFDMTKTESRIEGVSKKILIENEFLQPRRNILSKVSEELEAGIRTNETSSSRNDEIVLNDRAKPIHCKESKENQHIAGNSKDCMIVQRGVESYKSAEPQPQLLNEPRADEKYGFCNVGSKDETLRDSFFQQAFDSCFNISCPRIPGQEKNENINGFTNNLECVFDKEEDTKNKRSHVEAGSQEPVCVQNGNILENQGGTTTDFSQLCITQRTEAMLINCEEKDRNDNIVETSDCNSSTEWNPEKRGKIMRESTDVPNTSQERKKKKRKAVRGLTKTLFPSKATSKNDKDSQEVLVPASQESPNASDHDVSQPSSIKVDSCHNLTFTVNCTLSEFCIIDVASDPRLFKTFFEEWNTKEKFSVSLACEKAPERPSEGGIGWRIQGRSRRKPQQQDIAGLVVDTAGSLGGLVVVGLAVCWGGRDAYYINLRINQHENLSCSLPTPPIHDLVTLEERIFSIKDCLAKGLQDKRVMQAWDVKSHVRILAASGLGMTTVSMEDPRVAAWLIDQGAKEKNIHNLVINHNQESLELLEQMGSSWGVGGLGINVCNKGSARVRAATECVVVYQLMECMKKQLDEANLLDAFSSIEMPVVQILASMELNGMGFSQKECERQKTILKAHLETLEEEAYGSVGHPFSLTSLDQISSILYKHLHLPLPPGFSSTSRGGGRGRGGRGAQMKGPTNKDALERLKNFHPLPSIILEWRRITSSLTKVLFPLQNVRHPNKYLGMDRIHTLTHTFTATGRITMHEPNLQNIPKDFNITVRDVQNTAHNKTGRTPNNSSVMSDLAPFLRDDHQPHTVSLRHAMVACKDHVLLAVDYSQLELRILAHLSGDEKLCRQLNSGEDVFKMIAAQLHCTEVEDVSEEHRQEAKQICYGMIYGMGPKALGDQLNIDENAAYTFMETFKDRYPGVKRFLLETIQKSQKNGYVLTMMKRRRYLPNMNSMNLHIRAQCERQAVNTAIQGSAADLVKLAMIRIDQALQETFPDTSKFLTQQLSGVNQLRGGYLVLQLQDELIYEVVSDDIIQVAQLVLHHMEGVLELKVSLPVKMKVGPSWGDMCTLTL
ncbi:DNA polymerase theta [Oratosquilla oratoria]|uniref:DNA polymerase theta n=1 Tax=Oratosquilla oratoria TaxID=337810 RepID=UPI003F76352B